MGGTYTVASENKIIECVAQKKIKQNAKLLIGDEVEFFEENDSFFITKIYERKNELLRPPVANVEKLMIVIAPTPAPDYLLVDKLIIYANANHIKTLLVVNKCDLFDSVFIENVKEQYETVVDEIVLLSAKHKLHLEELTEKLNGTFSVFAGQSAVGKSTILNALGFDLETGELSKKTERGKHTTRHTEVFMLNENTLLADTPGFSLLELFEVNPHKLHEYYTDFNPFKDHCKYRACNHIQMLEKECAVKQAVVSGALSKARYERYAEHYEEVKKRWDSKYD